MSKSIIIGKVHRAMQVLGKYSLLVFCLSLEQLNIFTTDVAKTMKFVTKTTVSLNSLCFGL